MLQLQRYLRARAGHALCAADCPAELARIIHQLLAKDPQRALRQHPDSGAQPGGDAAGIVGVGQAPRRRLHSHAARGRRSPRVRQHTATPDDDPGPVAAARRAARHAPRLAAGDRGHDGLWGGEQPSGLLGTAERRCARRHRDSPKSTRRPNATTPPRSASCWQGSFTPQTLALLAALILLIAAGWYLMRPESADALYARIEAAGAEGDQEALKNVRRDMAQFLERYPDDARAEQVRSLEDELQQSSPIQRAYAEARRYALISPDVAAARYQALIDVYDDGAESSESTRHYVKLARQATRPAAETCRSLRRRSAASRRLASRQGQRFGAARPAGRSQDVSGNHRAVRRQALGRRSRAAGPRRLGQRAAAAGES